MSRYNTIVDLLLDLEDYQNNFWRCSPAPV